MNSWIIAIVIGVLVLGTLGIVSFVKADSQTEKAAANTQSAASSCSGCGSKCTAEKNCGLSTCGAGNGGACGCGK